MHEFGLCEAVVDAVRNRAGGRQVRRLRVQMGVLLRADEESMDLAFAAMSAGTELEGAQLDIVSLPATGICHECRFSFETFDPLGACPRCGDSWVELRGGREMVLESIEYAPGGG
jgi:hydrogenase nickel incorporation protein HypA/HybF